MPRANNWRKNEPNEAQMFRTPIDQKDPASLCFSVFLFWVQETKSIRLFRPLWRGAGKNRTQTIIRRVGSVLPSCREPFFFSCLTRDEGKKIKTLTCGSQKQLYFTNTQWKGTEMLRSYLFYFYFT